jgi:hypothetical protein
MAFISSLVIPGTSLYVFMGFMSEDPDAERNFPATGIIIANNTIVMTVMIITFFGLFFILSFLTSQASPGMRYLLLV